MKRVAIVSCLLPLAGLVAALGEEQIIAFPTHPPTHLSSDQTVFSAPSSSDTDLFYLASNFPDASSFAPPILLDSKDDEAIHIAAQTFAEDVYRVSGIRPELYNDTLPGSRRGALIVGTADSHLISSVHGASAQRKSLQGKWESYEARIHSDPLPGISAALVIAGSDRRGTIYALYTISEQMGVSPFHYWADVPVRPHHTIGWPRKSVLAHGEPTVKYRGVFINDEYPAMAGWAAEKWGYKPWEPHFLPDMYTPWFEMMLRLKANYFWPAMYLSSFDLDGVDHSQGMPQPPFPGPNQVLAQRMGIVMGTSHHEPMARNKPEWDQHGNKVWDWNTNEDFLYDWWKYGAERAKGSETMFTLGMRGDGDMPLTGASNELVQNITAAQQGILRDVYGDKYDNVAQMWCMYKEVAEYYLNGLEVPDDVSILFADDNYGNIMSVMPPEKPHPGGAGIYYHVDYVGMPRAYKWIHTISLAKTWEQMNIARSFNTTAIWIVNVGTLKPLELPTEHFLSLAWDMDAWPVNSVPKFLHHWASREFGPEHASEVADIMGKYSIYASRNKAELVNSTSYSFANYGEAERVLAEWDDLVARSEKVYNVLPEDTKPAFYELVYMLCALQANLNRMKMSVGRAYLYSIQGRTSTNYYSEQAIAAFKQDYNLTETLHSLLDRKWDHMLDQAHLSYHVGLEPSRDALEGLTFVNPLTPTRPGIPVPELYDWHDLYVRVGVENSRGAWPGDSMYNCQNMERCGEPILAAMDPFGSPTRWIDVSTGGPRDISWTITSSDRWLKVSQSSGKVTRDMRNDVRLYVSVDWSAAPAGSSEGVLEFRASDYSNVTITVPINNFAPPASDFKGFVQGDGYVVIEAEHFARNASSHGYTWKVMEGYGRSLSGLEMFPTTTQNFTAGTGPALEYDFWTHGDSFFNNGTVQVKIDLGPTLNFLPGRELAFAFAFDDGEAIEMHPIPTKPLGMYTEPVPDGPDRAIGAVPIDWAYIVMDEIRHYAFNIQNESLTKPGKHTIKIFGMTAGIVLERIQVDFGGVAARGYSYLGPPESKWV